MTWPNTSYSAGTETINYDSFFASTLKYLEPGLKENFVKGRPTLDYLFNNYKNQRGGYLVQLNMEFGTNSGTKFFTGPFDTVTPSVSETAIPAQYNWRHLVSYATWSEIETAMNTGKEALFDLAESRISQALRSARTLIGSEVFSDGTNYGGNTIVGLAGGINTAPATTTVGGVSPVTYNWWRNNATTSAGSFAANGVNGTNGDAVFTMFNNCSDGDRMPTRIVSAQDVFEYYNRSLQQQVRITTVSGNSQNLGWDTLEYLGRPWSWDRQCPAGRMYFLNQEMLGLYIDPSMFFKWTEPATAPNGVSKTRLLLLKIAMCYRVRMFLGVIDGWTA